MLDSENTKMNQKKSDLEYSKVLANFIMFSTSIFPRLRRGKRSPDYIFIFVQLKPTSWDFPGGPVVKNLPSKAGDVGSTPGQRTKILHAARELSPCSLEPVCCN